MKLTNEYLSQEQKNIPTVEIHPHNLIKMDSIGFGKAIESDFGIHLITIEKVTKGYQNQVHKATTAEGRTLFIRINKKREVFEAELLGYEMFEQIGIPVPSIIGYQASPSAIGYPTMIIHSAEGIGLDEADLSMEQEKVIYEEMGRILRKINGVKLEGFGPLEIVDGVLKGKFKSYEEYYKYLEYDFKEAIAILISNNLVTAEEAEKLRKIFKEISSLDLRQASLLLRDIKKEHVFVSQDRITGIIDLGRLTAGDPRNDIAKCLLFQSQRQQGYFKKGYGGLMDDPLVSKYLAISSTTRTVNNIFNQKGQRRIYKKPDSENVSGSQ